MFLAEIINVGTVVAASSHLITIIILLSSIIFCSSKSRKSKSSISKQGHSFSETALGCKHERKHGSGERKPGSGERKHSKEQKRQEKSKLSKQKVVPAKSRTKTLSTEKEMAKPKVEASEWVQLHAKDVRPESEMEPTSGMETTQEQAYRNDPNREVLIDDIDIDPVRSPTQKALTPGFVPPKKVPSFDKPIAESAAPTPNGRILGKQRKSATPDRRSPYREIRGKTLQMESAESLGHSRDPTMNLDSTADTETQAPTSAYL